MLLVLFFIVVCALLFQPTHIFSFWQFNDMINVPFSSKAFVAGSLALFLDATLHNKDSQTRKDRGMHWWDRFSSFKTDTRSEEFYSLPFNLNKFFPSVWLDWTMLLQSFIWWGKKQYAYFNDSLWVLHVICN